jgi:hypothetical protein
MNFKDERRISHSVLKVITFLGEPRIEYQDMWPSEAIPTQPNARRSNLRLQSKLRTLLPL